MSLGLNQSLWMPSIVVSIATHGIVLAVLSHSPDDAWLHSQTIKPMPSDLTYIEATVVHKAKFNPGENSQSRSAIANETRAKKTALGMKAVAAKKTFKTTLANKPTVHPQKLIDPKTKKLMQHTLKISVKQLAQKKSDIQLAKAKEATKLTTSYLRAVAESQSFANKPIILTSHQPSGLRFSKSPASVNNKASLDPKVTLAKAHGLGNSSHFNRATVISTALPPLIRSRQPDYPEEARWEERTGKAIIKFKISGQGSVLTTQISKSSGHRDLDMAAIRAIQLWRFKPKETQSANQWYQYSFRFELN